MFLSNKIERFPLIVVILSVTYLNGKRYLTDVSVKIDKEQKSFNSETL
jgi:hypothetical protein